MPQKKQQPKSKTKAKPKTQTKEIAVINPENEIAMIKGDVTPGQMIMAAIQGKCPIETIEKLLALAEKMKALQARDEYCIALAAFQKECPIIKKTKTVYNKDNTIRYKYASIEDLVEQTKELLAKHGLSYHLDSEQDETGFSGICVTHHIAGHSETIKFKIPIDKSAYMTVPQQVASASTFAERYAFKKAFGIMTADDDDDANSATDIAKKTKKIIQQNESGNMRQVNDLPEYLELSELLKNPSAQGDKKSYDNVIRDLEKMRTNKEVLMKWITYIKQVIVDTEKQHGNNTAELDDLANVGFEDDGKTKVSY